ncbi:hypothetical protein AX14_008590, partial [Amanita brunnescens Koide BX004]
MIIPPYIVKTESPKLVYVETTSIPSLFTGNVINLVLYGALTVQLYLYYISFPQDPCLLKTVVYLIYVIETVCTVLLTYDLEHYMRSIESAWTISLIVIPAGGGIVAFLVQATYAYRVRVLSQLKYVSWCIIAIIGGSLGFVMALAPSGAVNVFDPAFQLIQIVWTSFSLGIDATIAGIMIWSLTKNKILSKQLKFKVTRLIYLIIGTGSLT